MIGQICEWELVSMHLVSGTEGLSSASVCLRRRDGKLVQDAACGEGPMDAVFRVIQRITGVHVQLLDYQVSSAGVGEGARSDVCVAIEHVSCVYQSRKTDADSLTATASALLEVINQALVATTQEGMERLQMTT